MPEHALKEWAVAVAALAAGDQVLIVRKGGIGEKRFELPHPRFYLFPTYAHQRPELVKPAARERFGDPLAQREDPERLPLAVYAELVGAHPIADPDALAAIDHLHVLTPDYASERLRWRRKHPLWAAILRVWRVPEPPVLAVGPEHGGCVSWVELPAEIGAPTGRVPALDDEAFARAAADVEAALAAAGVTG
ncbi:DUF1802 family protein [Miltoncostaea marina]|uniref:DUF1802 family protein n=1 Tax=Miltoncostaea marina TaxID=2843215 RepID=UPI001C3D1B54|nr:DUF1802 family protein [Miltoncostaea marina]